MSLLNETKNELKRKASEVEKLSKEKSDLLMKLERRSEMQQIKQEELINGDISDLISDNVAMNENIKELKMRCAMLENECTDFERIVREQTELMKALNVRTQICCLLATCTFATVLIFFLRPSYTFK
jgi:hypothetical protein